LTEKKPSFKIPVRLNEKIRKSTISSCTKSTPWMSSCPPGKARFSVLCIYIYKVHLSCLHQVHSFRQGRDRDAKVTVYKKTDSTYMLKMKNSREFFSTVSKKHGTMPFTLRSFENETKARMGVVECAAHHLVDPYHVLYEKEGEYVAQFKFTLLLMQNGPDRITGLAFDPTTCESTKQIEDSEIQVRKNFIDLKLMFKLIRVKITFRNS